MLRHSPPTTRVPSVLDVLDDGVNWNHYDGGDDCEEKIEDRRKHLVDDSVD